MHTRIEAISPQRIINLLLLVLVNLRALKSWRLSLSPSSLHFFFQRKRPFSYSNIKLKPRALSDYNGVHFFGQMRYRFFPKVESRKLSFVTLPSNWVKSGKKGLSNFSSMTSAEKTFSRVKDRQKVANLCKRMVTKCQRYYVDFIQRHCSLMTIVGIRGQVEKAWPSLSQF